MTNTGHIVSALIIAPIAYVAGGFLSQHTETVFSTEEFPIYTSKGLELAMEKGFESEELTEIFCLSIIYYCVFASSNSRRQSVMIGMSIFLSVFSATFTETTLVEETRHDWNEHIQHSVVFFLIFWLVPILLLGCVGGSSEKTRID